MVFCLSYCQLINLVAVPKLKLYWLGCSGVKGEGSVQLVEALVHLQLLPEGALRLTRQMRESVQPPLLI